MSLPLGAYYSKISAACDNALNSKCHFRPVTLFVKLFPAVVAFEALGGMDCAA